VVEVSQVFQCFFSACFKCFRYPVKCSLSIFTAYLIVLKLLIDKNFVLVIDPTQGKPTIFKGIYLPGYLYPLFLGFVRGKIKALQATVELVFSRFCYVMSFLHISTLHLLSNKNIILRCVLLYFKNNKVFLKVTN